MKRKFNKILMKGEEYAMYVPTKPTKSEDRKIPANGCGTHLVLKVGDLEGALSPEEIRSLVSMIRKVELYRELKGKAPSPQYFVCNEDEPYAGKVELAILRGEETKAKESEREV